MSSRVAVILSGCGFLDGTEITEAVSILVALDRRGAHVTCAAPNIPQASTVDHVTGKPVANETRNVMIESARIARGQIVDLAQLNVHDFDAVILPGGFGAAKNLCDFASKSADCTVQPDVARALKAFHAEKKPIGLACIAPVIAARVFGQMKIKTHLTIGTDPDTARAIEKMGAAHINTGPADVCVDEPNRIVTTPCYMNEVGPWIVYQGAEKLVEEVLRLTGDVGAMVREHMSDPHVRGF